MKRSPSAITLDPNILGFWVRCMRATTHMSQDGLAAAAGLDVRTIQRIESGHAVNLTTRRCLARGLGYDDCDKFDDPEFIATVTSLLSELAEQQLNEQYPDCIRLEAARIVSGDALGRFAETSNAMMLQPDDDISPEAKETAAALFDFVRDMMDVGETSFADKLSYNAGLDNLRRDLEAQGTALYSALRRVTISNKGWPDPSPISFTVGYLAAVPRGKEVTELIVPKRCQFS